MGGPYMCDATNCWVKSDATTALLKVCLLQRFNSMEEKKINDGNAIVYREQNKLGVLLLPTENEEQTKVRGVLQNYDVHVLVLNSQEFRLNFHLSRHPNVLFHWI